MFGTIVVANALITVNLSQSQAELAKAMPEKSDVTRVLKGIGAAAMSIWKAMAQQELKSTARDYIAGLQVEEGGKESKSISIVLNGRTPNMVEQGWPGGDMRQWLLKGKNVKQGANGPYNTVPFRHGTPGTGGRNVGNPMPQAIYDVAKNLMPTLSRPKQGGGEATTKWGERLHPGSRGVGHEAASILGRKEKPWHATSVYMGMVRKGKHVAGGAVQTTGFITFRRISQHSADPRHWMHPGIKPRKLAEKVQAQVDKIASQIVLAAMGEVTK